MPVYLESSKTRHKIFFVTEKIKKVYIGEQKVYSAGSTVTYRVDSGVTYREEVDSGASCLSPKSFTPAKSGYAFLGWRTDIKPETGICGSLVMEDSPITLYAVFRKTVTVTFYNGTATAGKQTGYQYYNNGNLFNPSFKLTQASLSGWYPRGWSGSPNPDGSVLAGNGAAFTQNADITLYGLYYKTVKLTTSIRGTVNNIGQNAYYNSSGRTTYPSFTVQNPSVNGTVFKGWSTKAGSATIAYKTFADIQLASNTILYAVFKYNDAAISGSRTGVINSPGHWHEWNGQTVASGINAAIYEAVTITYTASASVTFIDGWWNIYLCCGTTKLLIMSPSNGEPVAQHTATKTLAVPATSGTVSVTMALECSANGTVGYGFLQPSTIKLTGRTTVG